MFVCLFVVVVVVVVVVVFLGGGYIRNYMAIPCHVDTAAWPLQGNGPTHAHTNPKKPGVCP